MGGDADPIKRQNAGIWLIVPDLSRPCDLDGCQRDHVLVDGSRYHFDVVPTK